MGLYGTLRRASAADVARMRAEPALVDAFLHGERPSAAPRGGGGVFGFLRRLLPVTVTTASASPEPAAGVPSWPEAGEGEAVELDKMWHGLHYLLTGSADERPLPAGFLLSGGEVVGEDEGDGTPRLLDQAQVRAIADLLAALDADELTRRFDARRMTELEIYPDPIWRRDEDPDGEHTPLGWLLDAFAELQAFMVAAASAGDAVVVDVS